MRAALCRSSVSHQRPAPWGGGRCHGLAQVNEQVIPDNPEHQAVELLILLSSSLGLFMQVCRCRPQLATNFQGSDHKPAVRRRLGSVG